MAYEEIQSEPSVATSLGRAIEAGQRIVVSRIDLARLDILQVVNRVSRGAVLVVSGAVLACVGWLALTAAAIAFTHQYLTLPASAALVGLLNAAVGAGLIAVGMQRAQGEPTRDPTHGRGNGA